MHNLSRNNRHKKCIHNKGYIIDLSWRNLITATNIPVSLRFCIEIPQTVFLGLGAARIGYTRIWLR